MNRVMHAAGVLVKAFRASGKDPSKVKPYWKLGEAGERIAVEVENQRSPEPVVQYFDGRFDELLDYLAPTIDAMVREGEIKPVARDHEKGEQYRAALEVQQRKHAGEAF
ncbi:hypothetical protein [Paraburkholderia haematera]|nr:hypothetical protein [Paraburkholderia haematera]